MNAFHVCGGILAIWAVVLSFLGITREGFPGSGGTARLVGAISVILVVGAIGTGIYTAANEEEHDEEEGGEEAALVLPA